MKTRTLLLLGCCIAIVGAFQAMTQQDVESQTRLDANVTDQELLPEAPQRIDPENWAIRELPPAHRLNLPEQRATRVRAAAAILKPLTQDELAVVQPALLPDRLAAHAALHVPMTVTERLAAEIDPERKAHIASAERDLLDANASVRP